MTTNPDFLPTTEYALLGFLNEGPCHGYELHKRLTDPEGIGMIWGVKIANMYAQLEKLARKGLIHGEIQEHEQRPARTEYSLTPAGKDEFQRWLTRMIEHPRDFRHDFMARVYFLLRLQPEKLPALIDQQLSVTQRWLTNTLEKETALSKPATFENLTYHFRVSQIQSMVDWLTWLKDQLQISHSHRGEQ
jgi:DNA-binding PadR family transcriptional regulator